jgi:hypothetical protein
VEPRVRGSTFCPLGPVVVIADDIPDGDPKAFLNLGKKRL